MKLSQAPFGTSRDQKAVSLYTLSNARGMTVEICNIGCSIVSVKVPDRDGNSVDVALGYDTVPEYEANPSAFGAVTGQFAARIRRGQYQWNGKTVQLELNEGNNNIHGLYRGQRRKDALSAFQPGWRQRLPGGFDRGHYLHSD